MLAVGFGIAFPGAAPALVLVAIVATCTAILSVIPYAIRYKRKLESHPSYAQHVDSLLEENLLVANNTSPVTNLSLLRAARVKFKEWVRNHKGQALLVFVGLGFVFAATLILTIGFFTGGTLFAFMTPVFATLGTPFVTAATAVGVTGVAEVVFTALAGTALILASLNVTNTFKRIAAWIDGFSIGRRSIDHSQEDKPGESLGLLADTVVKPFKDARAYFGNVLTNMSLLLTPVTKNPYHITNPMQEDKDSDNDDKNDIELLVIK